MRKTKTIVGKFSCSKLLFFITVLWCLFINVLSAQTNAYNCYKHNVMSQNGKYYLQTIPFDFFMSSALGKTTVFNLDSIKSYEIDRCFELEDNSKEIFLSNDGTTIVYVIDREFKYYSVNNRCIMIFKNGSLVREVKLSDIFDCNDDYEKCHLFYDDAIDTFWWEDGEKKITFKSNASEFEKQLTERSTYFSNDTLYVFSNSEKLVTIDLKSANLSVSSSLNIDFEKFKQIPPVKKYRKKIALPQLIGFPLISDGRTLSCGLAEYLEMAVCPENWKRSRKYKSYDVKMKIIIDWKGAAVIDKIVSYDGLPVEKIKNFIESQKFDSSLIPSETEKWRFEGWICLMNKSKRIAKKERRLEIVEEKEAYKKRIVADSINGLYIPRNLEECFIELDKLLKLKDIEKIKNLKSKSELALYHLGLGMWLRNNWGLWGGSRLQIYFFEKGIKHPDNMSGIILNFYYDWLNGQHEQWKKFEAK